MKTTNKNTTCHYPAGLDNPKKAKGFTLVELIIVITILAILATIAFISFQRYTSNSRDSNRLATLNQIEKGLNLIEVRTGKYPNIDNKTGTGTFGGEVLSYVGNIGESTSRLIQMNTTPGDPLTGNNYLYATDINNRYYQIATTLENPVRAKVLGNYNGLLKNGTKLSNIPSLLFTQTGDIAFDTETEINFIIDEGQNLPYTTNIDQIQNNQNIQETLEQVGSTAENLVYVEIKAENIEELLGYDSETIGIEYYGDDYIIEHYNNGGNDGGGDTGDLFSIIDCPTHYTPTNRLGELSRDDLLINITDYIGCKISEVSGIIAGYTYDGVINDSNKMILLAQEPVDYGYGDEIHLSNNALWINFGEHTKYNISHNPIIEAIQNNNDYPEGENILAGEIESWDGYNNSQLAITQLSTTIDPNTAFGLCDSYNAGGQDWYLPATEELNQFYCYADTTDSEFDEGYSTSEGFGWNLTSKCVEKGYPSNRIGSIKGFSRYDFWSSTEIGENNYNPGQWLAYVHKFNGGTRHFSYLKNTGFWVTCASRL